MANLSDFGAGSLATNLAMLLKAELIGILSVRNPCFEAGKHTSTDL